MKVLVTGGAGFVGSRLVRALLARGDSVRVLDDFSTGRRERLDGLNNVEILEGSVATPVTAGRAVAGVDMVLHLAAVVSVMRSVNAPLETHRTNATGTMVMLEAARAAGVRGFVLASSCAVYGDRDGRCRETDVPLPMSPYAASKLAAEHYVASARVSYGMRATALRFFNIFGPGQLADGDYAAVVPKFIALMRAGKTPTIFGDGRQTRDFVYLDDAVAAFLRAADVLAQAFGDGRTPALPPVMNVGTGNSVEILELLKTICRVARKECTPAFAPARAGEIRISLATADLAASRLGWKPSMSLENGLRAML